MTSQDLILLLSDKSNLHMIISKIYRRPCCHFVIFDFLMGKANKRTILLRCL